MWALCSRLPACVQHHMARKAGNFVFLCLVSTLIAGVRMSGVYGGKMCYPVGLSSYVCNLDLVAVAPVRSIVHEKLQGKCRAKTWATMEGFGRDGEAVSRPK